MVVACYCARWIHASGYWDRLATCFTDYRNPNSIEHSVQALVAQRVYGLALGYEDLNDHDVLRKDSVLALLVGKQDLTGDARVREQDRGHPLAGSSTLNRLELSTPGTAPDDRYKKVAADPAALDGLLVDVFLESQRTPPREIWLDLDATDDPLHGHQEGRFFHGYYRCYCYLPLYIFCGEHLLCARLRSSSQDAAAGSVDENERIVTQIRQRWPKTRIVIRGDAGFCREAIMAWCEANDVRYVLAWRGINACNARWVKRWKKPVLHMSAPASQRAGSAISATKPAESCHVSGGS